MHIFSQFELLIILAIAYLFGSIPFGLIIAKISGHGDIRTQGSGNIGATNVVRIAGKKLGYLTLALDTLKGVLAMQIAKFMGADFEILCIVGAFVCLGHAFPVWLKFKGGKAVATSFAVLLFLNYQVALITALVWAIIYLPSKIVALASMFAAISAPIIIYYYYPNGMLLYLAFFLEVLIVVRHIPNIRSMINKAAE